MFDLSLLRSKDLGDMLRFLPGVVVQKPMTMQGMADLYMIKPDLLKRIIKFTMHPPLAPSHYIWDDYFSHHKLEFYRSYYILDDYLSGFLQDRNRYQLYYDPMLQNISICRHFLAFLDGSYGFDLQS